MAKEAEKDEAHSLVHPLLQCHLEFPWNKKRRKKTSLRLVHTPNRAHSPPGASPNCRTPVVLPAWTYISIKLPVFSFTELTVTPQIDNHHFTLTAIWFTLTTTVVDNESYLADFFSFSSSFFMSLAAWFWREAECGWAVCKHLQLHILFFLQLASTEQQVRGNRDRPHPELVIDLSPSAGVSLFHWGLDHKI